MAETPIVKRIQIKLSELGYRLFRNNVGKLKTKDGAWVTFGLCEGSSDLIGWASITVTPDMVGKKVAVFTAIEVKAQGGRTEKARMEIQGNFVRVVRESGGLSGFATSEEEAILIVRGKIGESTQL